MKKTYRLYTMLLCILLFSVSCKPVQSSLDSEETVTPFPTTVIQIPTSSPEELSLSDSISTPAPSVSFGKVTTKSKTLLANAKAMKEEQTALEEMTPVLASLTCFLNEHNVLYNPKDPQFFWEALAYILNNYGMTHPFIEIYTDGSIAAKKEAVQEYASALFADHSKLPDIPSTLADFVSYNKSYDSYLFTSSDSFDDQVIILDSTKNEDDTITVLTTLEGSNCVYHFTLAANSYQNSTSDSSFLYSVVDVHLET